LFLLLPGTYVRETYRKVCVDGFEEGIEQAENDPMTAACQTYITEEQLIPLDCPECGGEAELWVSYPDGDFHYCGCRKCGYHRRSLLHKGAITYWNEFVKRYKENVGQPLFKED
jgi:hypothetical protein